LIFIERSHRSVQFSCTVIAVA